MVITEVQVEDLMLMEVTYPCHCWERFVVLTCDQTSDILTVNDTRKYLVTQKSRSLENILPTQAELPTECGWWKDTTGSIHYGRYRKHPLWTTLPEGCHKLIYCAFKKGYTAKCQSCFKMHFTLLLFKGM